MTAHRYEGTWKCSCYAHADDVGAVTKVRAFLERWRAMGRFSSELLCVCQVTCSSARLQILFEAVFTRRHTTVYITLKSVFIARRGADRWNASRREDFWRRHPSLNKPEGFAPVLPRVTHSSGSSRLSAPLENLHYESHTLGRSPRFEPANP